MKNNKIPVAVKNAFIWMGKGIWRGMVWLANAVKALFLLVWPHICAAASAAGRFIKKIYQKNRWLSWLGIISAVVIITLLVRYNMPQNEKPMSHIEGYYAQQQQYTGGRTINNTAVGAVEVSQQGASTLLAVHLAQMDGIDMKPVKGVSKYTVSMLTHPSRLQITLPELTSWEYPIDEEWTDNPLVQGVYKRSSKNSAGGTLYVQLTSDAVYKVREYDGILEIELLPYETQEDQHFYVAANAFDYYVENELSHTLMTHGMTPVVCDDKASHTLLSNPFETQQQAQEFADAITPVLEKHVPEMPPIVMQLQRNQAPAYDDSVDIALYTATEIYDPAGTNGSSELWLFKTRFHAWDPISRRALIARIKLDTPDQADGHASEYSELWMISEDNRQRQLMQVEMSYLSNVKFSPDGNYIAMTENVSDDVRSLFVFSMENGVLTQLDEVIGSRTEGYDWDDENMLYMMSGMGSLSFMKYNPAEQEIEQSISPMEELPGESGDLRWFGDLIYFSDSQGKIYSFDINEQQRRAYTSGAAFELSPDGKYMAVLEYDASSDQDAYTRLKVVDISTGDYMIVSKNIPLASICWSPGATRLYYLTYPDMVDSEFSTRINIFDMTTKTSSQAGKLDTREIYPGTDEESLIAVAVKEIGSRNLTGTYIINIPK